MSLNKESEEVLLRFIPLNALPVVKHWMEEYPLKVKIVDERKTKAGDYRYPHANKPAQITVNVGSNPFRFLIILAHEYAHHIAFVRYGFYIKPHGWEWKNTFHELLSSLLASNVFPPQIAASIPTKSQQLKATATGNRELEKKLRQLENRHSKQTMVEDIPMNSVFTLPDGKLFKKLEKRRVRFVCRNLDNNKLYLFSPEAEVQLLMVEES